MTESYSSTIYRRILLRFRTTRANNLKEASDDERPIHAGVLHGMTLVCIALPNEVTTEYAVTQVMVTPYRKIDEMSECVPSVRAKAGRCREMISCSGHTTLIEYKYLLRTVSNYIAVAAATKLSPISRRYKPCKTTGIVKRTTTKEGSNNGSGMGGGLVVAGEAGVGDGMLNKWYLCFDQMPLKG